MGQCHGQSSSDMRHPPLRGVCGTHCSNHPSALQAPHRGAGLPLVSAPVRQAHGNTTAAQPVTANQGVFKGHAFQGGQGLSLTPTPCAGSRYDHEVPLQEEGAWNWGLQACPFPPTHPKYSPGAASEQTTALAGPAFFSPGRQSRPVMIHEGAPGKSSSQRRSLIFLRTLETPAFHFY